MITRKEQKQAIAFTKKQFKALLKAVFLGNWMANAYRVDDIKKDYENIEDYIFSLAPQFGFDKYMNHEDSDGDKYYPTSSFEETTDVHMLHEAYDEENFWDELADRLGERDFFERYSADEIQKMSREEYFDILSDCVDAYHEEFEKFGLERIRVSGKKYVEYN